MKTLTFTLLVVLGTVTANATDLGLSVLALEGPIASGGGPIPPDMRAVTYICKDLQLDSSDEAIVRAKTAMRGEALISAGIVSQVHQDGYSNTMPRDQYISTCFELDNSNDQKNIYQVWNVANTPTGFCRGQELVFPQKSCN